MNEKWFDLGIDQIEKKLKTNSAAGLSPKAARSRGNGGAGHLFFLPSRSSVRIILDLFADFSIVILLLGSAFSLFFGMEETVKGLSVLIITLANLIVCGIMYYRSERTVESLSSLFYPTVRVIRNGRLYRVDFRHVVVGDVILLEAGDVLCCDARLVTSDNLRVRMRIDANNYVSLDKFADGHVAAGENRAAEMVNMIHAGSIIESGSARAIVTAVGKYTYLGAMTGGISLPISNKRPKLLEKMRKQFSKVNIVMLILVIPFSIISLLFGKMIPDREALLSVTFLTGIAIAATVMSQLACTMLKIFYTQKIRSLVSGESPAVVRSVEAFDRLTEVDYLFMLDGCVATDGVQHFSIATCAEGEIRNYEAMNKTAVAFAEHVYLYYSAANRALTTGISGSQEYLSGIGEFLSKSTVDPEALNIRCSILSYAPGNMKDMPERVFFLDQGVKYCLNVSTSSKLLHECNEIMLSGVRQTFSIEGKRNFERIYNNYSTYGHTPIIFTISSCSDSYSSVCFVGMVVLKEGIDETFKTNVQKMERMGCKVVSFVGEHTVPKYPAYMIDSDFIAKDNFTKNNLPIHYGFGKISGYRDFSDQDILNLISYAHSKNEKVVILGFTERAAKIAQKADGFISCSDIPSDFHKSVDKEIISYGSSGNNGALMCAQTVKESADCLVNRPKDKQGGLTAILKFFREAITIRRNISGYIRYMLAANIITVVMVALPMLLGDATLDSRHIAFSSFVLGVFMLFAFMMRNGIVREKKDYCEVGRIRDYFTGDIEMVLSGVISSVLAVVLPWIVNFFDGRYSLYKTEYMFTSFLLLHIAVSVLMYYGNRIADIIYIYKNIFLMIDIGVTAVVWFLCFVWSEFGTLFGISGGMSAVYAVLSFVPAIVYVTIFLMISRKKQFRKTE